MSDLISRAEQTQAEKCEECIHHGTHKDNMTCKECASAETENPKVTERNIQSGDLISREDAIDAVCGDCTIETKESCKSDGYCYEVRNLLALPTADRPQGEWIDWLGSGNEWECSICKCSIESHGSIAYNYCPMCGARMGGNNDD